MMDPAVLTTWLESDDREDLDAGPVITETSVPKGGTQGRMLSHAREDSDTRWLASLSV